MEKRPAKWSENMSIRRHYLKSSLTCRVTFMLPKEATAEARSATLVGDSNNWDREATPKKRFKTETFL